MGAGLPGTDAVSTADAWPRTRRPMPWFLAAFLVMIFLVPFEAIHLDVPLPVSSDLDRFFVAALVAAFALCALLGERERIVRLRPRGWATGLIAFGFVAVASIAVNVDRITNLGEWETAQKRLAVLVALIAVGVVVTLTLRVAELRKFAVLIAVLATITAAGTIVEQRTGTNLFYDVSGAVFEPIATIDPAPTSAVGVELGDRPMVVGPTRHALSVASMLGMALPFAVVLAAVAASTRGRLLWVAAACVIITATLITQRKSGAVVPAFALLALFVLRPRQLLRLAPFGIVALALGLLLSGGTFNSVSGLIDKTDTDSTAGRTSDYPAVVPDLLTNPLLGRGYGTLDSARVDTYRIFDNQYLGQLYQTGALGLMAFLALIITPLVMVRSVLRSDHPLRGPPALAAGAGCLAFGVSTALYDVLSFLGAPYLFLFMAAMCTCAASVEVLRPPLPARAPLRLPQRYQLAPEGTR